MISVVICTYNRAELLEGCLKSLINQSLPESDYEVVVIDNNSSDNTWQIAGKFTAKHDNVRVVKEERQGKSFALNRGIAESTAEYIAFIDDDAKAYSDWLERILHAFGSVTPQPVAVGGKILPWYEVSPPTWFTDDMETRTWGPEKGYLKPPRAKYGFSGSNMAIPRNILEEFGGFVPGTGPVGDRFAIGDEITLFTKIYNKYPRFWYEPTICVEHLVPLYKMKVLYRIKRAYWGGLSLVLLQEKKSIMKILKASSYIIFKCCIIPFQVKWWSNDWQKSFIAELQLIGSAFGILVGNLFK